MERIKLTKVVLERFTSDPPKSRVEFTTDHPGVVLRVGPQSISLRVSKRDAMNKLVWESISIDRYEVPNLPTIKRLIKEAQVAPSRDKRTVSALLTSLLKAGEYVLNTRSYSPERERANHRDLRDLVLITDDNVPSKASQIRELHKELSQAYGKSAANNKVKLLRLIMRNMSADYPDFPPWPSKGLERMWNPENPRQRRLGLQDLAVAWNATLPDHWTPWMRFTLLTGMRRSETQRAFINGDRIYVDDTKNKTTHHLPLTPSIEQYSDDYSRFNDFKPFTKHLYRATNLDITPHDLRRTFTAVARAANVHQNIISWLTNQKSARNTVTADYMGRPEDSQLREALLSIEQVYRDYGCDV